MFYRGGGMPKTAVKPSDVLDNILPVPAPPAAPVQQVFFFVCLINSHEYELNY